MVAKRSGVARAALFLCPQPAEPPEPIAGEAGRTSMLARLMVLLEAHLTDAENQRADCGDRPGPAETRAGLDLIGQITRHLEKLGEMEKAAREERALRDAAKEGGTDEFERTAERVAARIDELVEARASLRPAGCRGRRLRAVAAL